MTVHTFDAPWDRFVKMTTAAVLSVLMGMVLVGWLIPRGPWTATIMVMPVLVLVGSAAFAIRGYVLVGPDLLVLRVGWATKVSLAHLVSVELVPGAMDQSKKVMGNGGIFCVCGDFSSPALGPYRAWVTAPSRAVVLRYPNQVVVVSPSDSERFVTAVREVIARESVAV